MASYATQIYYSPNFTSISKIHFDIISSDIPRSRMRPFHLRFPDCSSLRIPHFLDTFLMFLPSHTPCYMDLTLAARRYWSNRIRLMLLCPNIHSNSAHVRTSSTQILRVTCLPPESELQKNKLGCNEGLQRLCEAALHSQ
jgi:hypothetical protein